MPTEIPFLGMQCGYEFENSSANEKMGHVGISLF
jgi:hypothetical protein